MTHIRRYYVHGSPVFITTVCHQRRSCLRLPEDKALLMSVMREVKSEQPYRMLGYVILDDHFHWLILPQDPVAFPRIMQSVKLRFARRQHRTAQDPCLHIWQRRYWDRVIRDAHDLQRHLDYIHFNPVKHGAVRSPTDYRWSSFGEYLRRGRYTPDWGVADLPRNVDGLVPE